MMLTEHHAGRQPSTLPSGSLPGMISIMLTGFHVLGLGGLLVGFSTCADKVAGQAVHQSNKCLDMNVAATQTLPFQASCVQA